jgi:hypothetical protein
MTKKTFLKVIAAVLVMAFCFTTVFTGVVSAESRSATCSVSGYSYNEGAKDSYVTAEVTFTSATEFTAGSFTVAATGLSLVDCTTATEGVHVYVNPANGKILFAGFSESTDNDIISFTSLTLLVKFTVTAGALDAQAAGTTWTVNVTGIDVTNVAEEAYDVDNASGIIHVHKFDGGSDVSGKITTTHCSVDDCTAVSTEVNNDGTLGANSLEGSPKKAFLSFTKDGDTVLNALVAKSAVDAYDDVYFVYTYVDDISGQNITVTATSTKTGIKNIDGTDYYIFPCGRNGGVGRMGRNITGNFIAVEGGNATISGDWEYSIKAYLETLIASGSTAHQNYAKALWNFGKYTANAAHLTADYALFGDDQDVADWTLPTGKAVATLSDDWTLSGVSVTTGYKPKMNLRFNADGLNATVKVYDNGELVYSKEVALTGNTLTVSDIPTKYLIGDIEIGVKNSIKTISYSFGKYANARQGKDDADVFQSMMNYAYYLNEAFA